jgi:hypothetical protein
MHDDHNTMSGVPFFVIVIHGWIPEEEKIPFS